MTLVLMATASAAWVVAKACWDLAGAAHRSTERRHAGSQLGAPGGSQRAGADR